MEEQSQSARCTDDKTVRFVVQATLIDPSHDGRLRLGSLGDFFSHIPSGHLGNLPSHLKVCCDVRSDFIMLMLTGSSSKWHRFTMTHQKKSQTIKKWVPRWLHSCQVKLTIPFFVWRSHKFLHPPVRNLLAQNPAKPMTMSHVESVFHLQRQPAFWNPHRHSLKWLQEPI